MARRLWQLLWCLELGSCSSAQPRGVLEMRVSEDELPLRTSGRYIVSAQNRRVKWACVNWHGGSSWTHVAGGLEFQPIQKLVDMIVEQGFNCVRLAYSTQGIVENPIVKSEHVFANPSMYNSTHLDVLDETIRVLTEARIMIIINHHTFRSGWCCDPNSEEGMLTAYGYTKVQYYDGITFLADRYKDNFWVVAYDVKNEPHDFRNTAVTWGDNNEETDVALFMERAGNLILNITPDVLIVLAAPCYNMDFRVLHKHQVSLVYPNRVVMEAHYYQKFVPHEYLSIIMSNQDLIDFSARWMSICASLDFALFLFWWSFGRPLPPGGACEVSCGIWYGSMFWLFYIGLAWLEANTELCGVHAIFEDFYVLRHKEVILALAAAFTLILIVGCCRLSWMLRLICSLKRREQHRVLRGSYIGEPSPRRDEGNGRGAVGPAVAVHSPALQLPAPPSDGPPPSPSRSSEPRPQPPAERQTAEDNVLSERAPVSLPNVPRREPGQAPQASTPASDQEFSSVEEREHSRSRGGTSHSGSSTESSSSTGALCSCHSWSEMAKQIVNYSRMLLSDSRLVMCADQAARRAVATRRLNAFKVQQAKLEWDCGLCCCFQLFVVATLAFILLLVAYSYAQVFQEYWWFENIMDDRIGFVLEEGHNYTYPIWMGEFGGQTRSRYWLNLMRYMSDRDIDFAYWPWNGQKFVESEGYKWDGTRIMLDEPRYMDDSYGIMNRNYTGIRFPWMLLHLQAIRASPSSWFPRSPPCRRELLGEECGD